MYEIYGGMMGHPVLGTAKKVKDILEEASIVMPTIREIRIALNKATPQESAFIAISLLFALGDMPDHRVEKFIEVIKNYPEIRDILFELSHYIIHPEFFRLLNDVTSSPIPSTTDSKSYYSQLLSIFNRWFPWLFPLHDAQKIENIVELVTDSHPRQSQHQGGDKLHPHVEEIVQLATSIKQDFNNLENIN